MESITHIVQIFLDIERPDPNVNLPRHWVEDRVKLFNQFTLRSLLQQTRRDFWIFLICGKKHEEYTSSLPWHKRVNLIYPVGDDRIGATLCYSPRFKDKVPTLYVKEYLEFDTDYIAITRVDSDDMLHREAMQEIQAMARLHHKSEMRTRFLYRKFWKWHRLDRVLEQQDEASPPFYTHVFPKSIYKDRHTFHGLHFNNHRYLGGSEEHTLELSKNKVCVMSHQHNISRIKRGKPLTYMKICEKKRLLKRAPGSTRERLEIVRHLKPFGVRGEEV